MRAWWGIAGDEPGGQLGLWEVKLRNGTDAFRSGIWKAPSGRDLGAEWEGEILEEGERQEEEIPGG